MSAKEAAELKGLQVRLQKAIGALTNAKAAQTDAQRAVSEAQRDVNALEEQVKEFSKSEPVVTEHALLRYCERVIGVDLEAARAEILAPGRIAVIKAIGTGKLDMHGGLKIVFRNRAVVTIE